MAENQPTLLHIALLHCLLPANAANSFTLLYLWGTVESATNRRVGFGEWLGLENGWVWRLVGFGEWLGLKSVWVWRMVGIGEWLGLDNGWVWAFN